MKILALVIAVYTLPMLLIHVSTTKILKAWSGGVGSWITRHFSPQRALRVEAFYWLLTLLVWSIWQPTAWKVLVALFAAIHLGIWLAAELGKIQLSGEATGDHEHARRLDRAIIIFDLVEAVVLVAVGSLAVLYLMHAAGGLHSVAAICRSPRFLFRKYW